MKKNRINITETTGILAFKTFVNDNLGWLVRNQEFDVGVDLQMECLDHNGDPNGIFIGVQVKSGISNVKRLKKKPLLRYYISQEHYKYWLKLNIPMIFVLYDVQNKKIYWNKISTKNIIKTKKRYALNIPLSNELSSIEQIEQFASLNTELSDINLLIRNKDAAEKIFKSSVQFNPNNTDSLNQYALVLMENNYFLESMKLLNRAYKIELRKSNNVITEKTIIRKLNFAMNLLKIGKTRLCKKIVDVCFEDIKMVLGEKHELEIVIYNYYGQINRVLGNIDEAIANCEFALSRALKVNVEDELVLTYSNLSEMYIEKAIRSKEMNMILYKALDYQLDAFSLLHVSSEIFIDRSGIVLSKIGMIYYYLKDFKRSISYYLKSVDLQLKKYGPINTIIANRYINISNSYARLGQYDEARSYLLKSLEINLEKYGSENHYEIANIYFNWASQEIGQGMIKEAEIHFLKWEKIMDFLKLPIDRFTVGFKRMEERFNYKYDFRIYV